MPRAQLPLGPLLVAALILSASEARAGAKADADRLFEEALSALDRGRWDEACPKFRASMKADPAVGTLLNVATCSDREGRLLDALAEYRELLRLNASTTDLQRRASIEAGALEAIRLLEQRIPSVRMRVQPLGAEITVDGVKHSAGEDVRLTPGPHTIRVRAEGHRDETRTLRLAEAEHAEVEIVLESADGSKGAHVEAPDLGLAGWVTGAAGLGATTAGAVLLGLAAARASDIEDECGRGATPPHCEGDPAVANAISAEGERYQGASVGLLAVGGAALATGVILVALDATSSHEKVVAWPVVGPDGGGLQVRVAFR